MIAFDYEKMKETGLLKFSGNLTDRESRSLRSVLNSSFRGDKHIVIDLSVVQSISDSCKLILKELVENKIINEKNNFQIIY